MGKGSSRVYLSHLVNPNSSSQLSRRQVTADVLQQAARKMAPFYRTISQDPMFAGKWSEAVEKQEPERMKKLLTKASPDAGTNSPSANGTGYFISFPFTKPVGPYASGTAIPSGTEQPAFEPKAHQAVAAAVYPLYRTLADNRSFAAALANAIREDDAERVAVLVRSRVTEKALSSITTQNSGVVMTFRFGFSKYPYRNLLYRDVAGG